MGNDLSLNNNYEAFSRNLEAGAINDTLKIIQGFDGKLNNLLEKIEKIENIKKINFSLISYDEVENGLKNGELIEFINNLKKLNRFETIIFRSSSICEKLIPHIANFADDNNVLKKISLMGCQLVDKNLEPLCLLSNSKTLTSLDLLGNKLTSKSFIFILNNLKITKLKFNVEEIIKEEYDCFFKVISENLYLKKLVLDQVNEDFALGCLNALKKNFILESIEFVYKSDFLVDEYLGHIKSIKIFSLDLIKNWNLCIGNAILGKLHEKFRIANGGKGYYISEASDFVTPSDTLLLYWILTHIFPRELGYIIMNHSYWLQFPKNNRLEFHIWKKF
jgi:hypothetical protein